MEELAQLLDTVAVLSSQGIILVWKVRLAISCSLVGPLCSLKIFQLFIVDEPATELNRELCLWIGCDLR